VEEQQDAAEDVDHGAEKVLEKVRYSVDHGLQASRMS
jgi:hypothetical protein